MIHSAMTILITGLLGAFFYRFRGAPGLELIKHPFYWFYTLLNKPYPSWLVKTWPHIFIRPTKQMLCAWGLAVPAYHVTQSGIGVGIAYVLCVGALCMGHGAYMDLGNTPNPAKDQLDESPMDKFLPRLLKPRYSQNTFIYDAVGLTLTGLFYTLPFTILFFWCGFWVAGILALLAGGFKVVAYIISWKNPWRKGTEIGEWLTGFFLWAYFAIIYIKYGVAN